MEQQRKVFTNEDGKWETRGIITVLIEPSEEFLNKERKLRDEEILISSLTPTVEEVKKAEIKIIAAELLLEVGLNEQNTRDFN